MAKKNTGFEFSYFSQFVALCIKEMNCFLTFLKAKMKEKAKSSALCCFTS